MQKESAHMKKKKKLNLSEKGLNIFRLGKGGKKFL